MRAETETFHKEKDLLKQVAGGDAGAFRALYEKYQETVFSLAIHFTGHRETAEEVLQEIFLRIWTRREKLAVVENFEAWLFVIVRNQSFTHLRKLARKTAFENNWKSNPPDTVTQGIEWLEAKEYGQLMNTAIATLTPQQQKVYNMYRQGGITQQEIANELGLTKTTVNSHLIIARKVLTEYLRNHSDLAVFIGLLLAST